MFFCLLLCGPRTQNRKFVVCTPTTNRQYAPALSLKLILIAGGHAYPEISAFTCPLFGGGVFNHKFAHKYCPPPPPLYTPPRASHNTQHYYRELSLSTYRPARSGRCTAAFAGRPRSVPSRTAFRSPVCERGTYRMNVNCPHGFSLREEIDTRLDAAGNEKINTDRHGPNKYICSAHTLDRYNDAILRNLCMVCN